MTVWDIAQGATELNLKAVGIVDHVRGGASWFSRRLIDIEEARESFRNLAIFSGIEVSLAPQDWGFVPDKASPYYDFIVVSAHRIPEAIRFSAEENPSVLVRWWESTMSNLLRSDLGDVVGHPDRVLFNSGLRLDEGMISRFLEHLEGSHWFIEVNPFQKYPHQFLRWLSHRKSLRDHVVFGSDAHIIGDLVNGHASAGVLEDTLTSGGNQAFVKIMEKAKAVREWIPNKRGAEE